MKKYLFLMLFSAAALCANAEVKVKVTNPTPEFDRGFETIELEWNRLVKKDKAITPENVVVKDADGKEVVSQVVYDGNVAPQKLIFQVNLKTKTSENFTIITGKRSDYKSLVFGRFVPERMDDYAWENNVMAFRAYGPALEVETVSNGIDVWCKRTDNLVIDKWYKTADYHHDNGEGCDVYKVGNTMGCGASSPYADGKLFVSRNFAKSKTLDNGPIRTTVVLSYNTFDAGGVAVALEKKISLDANTHFNKVTDIYTGNFKTLEIAAGLAIHNGAEIGKGKNAIAIMEPASDSRTGEDGNIALAVIMPGMNTNAETPDNLIGVKSVKNGKPSTYYFGAGWSKNGVSNLREWLVMISEREYAISNPLVVKIL